MVAFVKSIQLISAGLVLSTSVMAWGANDAATSVVVNIQRSAQDVSVQVMQDLQRRKEDMVKRWEANLQKSMTQLEQAKDGGQTPAAQFEDQLSRTMQQVGQDLAEFIAQREAVQRVLEELEQVLTDGSSLYQAQQEKAQATVAQLNDELGKIEAELHALAMQYRAEISNGQLSPKIDILVRQLEAERRTRELRTQTIKRTVEVVGAQFRDLDQHRMQVEWLQGMTQVAFIQARGQLQLLGDLAQLRSLGVSYAQTSKMLSEFGKMSVDFSTILQQTQGLVDRLINLPLPADLHTPEQPPVKPVQSDESIHILKRYLDGSGSASR